MTLCKHPIGNGISELIVPGYDSGIFPWMLVGAAERLCFLRI